MAKYERYYEPSDDQAYDGGEDEMEEGGSRLPLLIAIVLIVVLAFFGVVYLAYTQGVEQGRTESPRLIAAPSADGQVAQSGKGLKIYEQPAPSDEEVDNETTPPPAPVTKMPPPPPMVKPSIDTQPPPKAEAPAPAATQAPKPAPAAAPAPPKSLAALNKAPLPAAAPSAAPAVAASGGFVLQVGAYKSEDEAKAAWHAYQTKHAAAAGYAPDIKQVDLGAKGTWYRLRIGPFADKGAADNLCDKLKADGGGCFPTKP